MFCRLNIIRLTLHREFQTPDEEMKKIVLKVVKQCVGTEGVLPAYIKTDVLPEFFKCFWNRRMALDRCAAKLLAGIVGRQLILTQHVCVSHPTQT